MKKKTFVVLTLIFMLTVGYAAVNTVLDLNGNINITYNENDFRLEISNLVINGVSKNVQISNDRQSFTFVGTGNDSIDYTVTNYSYQYDADVELVCYPGDNITISQIGMLEAQTREKRNITTTNTSEITCRLNIEKIGRTDYAEDMCPILEGTVWEFDYTGGEQEFIIPCDGEYKLETWGAQGGSYDVNYYGGYGAYSAGEILLNEDTLLFINSGGTGGILRNYGSPNNLTGGYNGGGRGTENWSSGNSSGVIQYNISGGGATHIALKSGELKTLENSKDDILVVASGGGGAQYFSISDLYHYCIGGHGGGVEGSMATCVGTINWSISYTKATQVLPGTSNYNNEGIKSARFGEGVSSYSGGGGGWYGGAGNFRITGGGSGYIGNPLLTNKVMYCYNCSTSAEESTKTISTTNVSTSAISNYAKQGNGYAKITYLGKKEN